MSLLLLIICDHLCCSKWLILIFTYLAYLTKHSMYHIGIKVCVPPPVGREKGEALPHHQGDGVGSHIVEEIPNLVKSVEGCRLWLFAAYIAELFCLQWTNKLTALFGPSSLLVLRKDIVIKWGTWRKSQTLALIIAFDCSVQRLRFLLSYPMELVILV